MPGASEKKRVHRSKRKVFFLVKTIITLGPKNEQSKRSRKAERKQKENFNEIATLIFGFNFKIWGGETAENQLRREGCGRRTATLPQRVRHGASRGERRRDRTPGRIKAYGAGDWPPGWVASSRQPPRCRAAAPLTSQRLPRSHLSCVC